MRSLIILTLALPLAALSDPEPTAPGFPASTNVRGAEYPRILPDFRVKFRIKAPNAQKVQFDLGRRYLAAKDAEGFWTATTDPLLPGFHYYWLVFDDQPVNDPASETFYGVGAQTSGIEIPEPGVDFYDVRDVPHGDVREHRYFSKTTGTWRRIFVYTPPGYDTQLGTRYPVLYLQHGGGEDERSWPVQGHVGAIMDNLIAENASRPMIVVMEQGYARRPGEPEVPLRPPAGMARSAPPDFTRLFSAFEDVMVNDLVPMIDLTYRTFADREHRAMAGLSMGGMETFIVTLDHLDTFSYIGGFSGAGGGFGGTTIDLKTAHNGVMADAKAFNQRVNLLWLGIGSAEPQRMQDSVEAYHRALNEAGIRHVYYVSPGTAHEWQTWRRSLQEFAPLLFPGPAPRPPAGQAPGGAPRAIVLGPDDHPAFDDPPAGFETRRDMVAHGHEEMVEYDSKAVASRRKMLVYTPPGYPAGGPYPVLYLLHGIGGDETEWQRFVTPDVLLDNLLAEGKIVPMIVVMPNGRAEPNDRAEGDIYSHFKAFENFEQDLLGDVIPAIESRYRVRADRDHRALAGLSMGGGQSLNFGLSHLDTFAWVGAFSPAPNTRPPALLVPDPAASAARLRLLWLSCGSRDGLIRIAQRLHGYLKQESVPHIWHVDGNAHDSPEWRNNLYLFSQRIFR